jgi:hypothetical protein
MHQARGVFELRARKAEDHLVRSCPARLVEPIECLPGPMAQAQRPRSSRAGSSRGARGEGFSIGRSGKLFFMRPPVAVG